VATKKSAKAEKPRKSATKTKAPTAPTDEDWRRVTHQFQLFNDLEDADIRHKILKLPKVLEREADAIYRLANQLSRTGKLSDDVDMALYTASAIGDRLVRRGYFLGDPFGAWLHEQLLVDLRERVTRSVDVLRKQADALQSASDAVQRILTLYTESLEMIRTAPRGRYPSVAMFWLIRTTDQWGSSIGEIARQLVKHEIESWSESEETDPTAQWVSILKKGRTRARRRGANDETDDNDGTE
jgi:hypothetical protein